MPAELSRAELDLMNVLWEQGELSAREIHDRVAEELDWSYSTTRTLLERLVTKGAAAKKEFHGLNLYFPTVTRPAGVASFVRDLADRVLKLDYATVVAMFRDKQVMSRAELSELKQILESEE